MKKISPRVAVSAICFSIVIIIARFHFFPKAFGADRLQRFSEAGIAALTIAVIGMICSRGFQSAKNGNVSVVALWVHVLIGLICVSLAKEVPLLGLGGLFVFYGLAGLIAVGFKKLSRSRNGHE